MGENEEDFSGPIGRVIEATPLLQESGVLLAMKTRVHSESLQPRPETVAVLLAPNQATALSEALQKAVAQWVETYRLR